MTRTLDDYPIGSRWNYGNLRTVIGHQPNNEEPIITRSISGIYASYSLKEAADWTRIDAPVEQPEPQTPTEPTYDERLRDQATLAAFGVLLETGDWSFADCARMSVEAADAFMAARKGGGA